jgi:hypothetical protein
VDHRGADPVPEHDSHGQLIYLAAEYYRQTGDRALLQRMWPRVEKAAAHIDSLRRSRMTPEYQAPEKRAFFGMLPQSISHEGYSAKPMHSYWDDFFAMRGLKDAANIASWLGRAEDARRLGGVRDEFRGHLMESIRRTMVNHRIEYIPGSVELGDFDATSTTVGVAPGGELHTLPQPALRRTFERYRDSSAARAAGRSPWENYTPYEWRAVGTFVQMGWKAEAHALSEFFFRHVRPAGWNHWAEVVWNDPATPRFIGDMPHTWVGSDFIRSVLDMFAYERESDSALVVGAGIPEAWVTEAPGVGVKNLHTHHGALTFAMRAEPAAAGAREVRVRIESGLRVPPGGIVVRSPLDRPIVSATVDGQVVAATATEVIVRRVPVEVVLRY